MPSGMLNWGGPKEALLDGGPELQWAKAVLRGIGVAHCKV